MTCQYKSTKRTEQFGVWGCFNVKEKADERGEKLQQDGKIEIWGNSRGEWRYNQKFWEDLIAYIPRYAMDHVENNTSSDSLIVACVFGAIA
jgi:hypothetical protein